MRLLTYPRSRRRAAVLSVGPIALGIVLGVCATAVADTIYVNCSCGDDAWSGVDPNCVPLDGPKRTIQAAIDAAVNDDEIVVAPGTYNEAIDFMGKAITVRSTDPSDPLVVDSTIIDGTALNDSVVKCVSGEGSGTVLEGFTITNGTGDPSTPFGDSVGGGMYNLGSSPTVTDCVFTGNTALHGGGMFNQVASAPIVSNCTFTQNSAGLDGGGMLNSGASAPMVTNCTFSGNTAGKGGGMYNLEGSNPTVADCTFTSNTTTLSGPGPFGGGGMYNDGSSPYVSGCTFSQNAAADNGGGMFNLNSNPTVINCTFSQHTGADGAGMFNANSSPTVIDCIFSANCVCVGINRVGGGMANGSGSNPTVTGCTFAGNSAEGGEFGGGGGIWISADSLPTIDESFFCGNTPDHIFGPYNDSGGNVFADECEVLANLDIKPGACPNLFNRNGHGVLPVALVGTDSFDAMDVDLSTVQLSRADGVGGSVAPNEGPPGPHSVFEDVATPFEGELCDCHELEGDGILDLSMKFRTDDVVAALLLNDLPAGDLVELVVSGTLLDGTEFSASDCIRLVPPGTPPGMLAVGSNAPGAFIDITPLDLQLDGGGFGSFERTFPLTSIVTLTAPFTHQGWVFIGWRVGDMTGLGAGSPLQPGQSIDITIRGEQQTVEAIYMRGAVGSAINP